MPESECGCERRRTRAFGKIMRVLEQQQHGGFDGVVQAVAVGLPDDEWGTIVGVMVEGSADESALSVAATSELASHERPRRWVVVDTIPTLETGKPDLGAVRRAMDER